MSHSSQSDGEDIESCYTCGIILDDENENYVTGFSANSEVRQFCSNDCMKKKSKYVAPQLDPTNPLLVPVKGTFRIDGMTGLEGEGSIIPNDSEVIQGVAQFDMHGTVRLRFSNPELQATIEIPKEFLDIVALLYQPQEVFE